MFSHMMLGSDDLDRSRIFYDSVFAAIGGPAGQTDKYGRLFYAHKGGRLLITRPIDGEPASAGNGSTMGMLMESPEQADAWHRAGVASGGTPIEDDPGIRQGPVGPLYLAYLRDPDGNKLCALHRLPA